MVQLLLDSVALLSKKYFFSARRKFKKALLLLQQLEDVPTVTLDFNLNEESSLGVNIELLKSIPLVGAQSSGSTKQNSQNCLILQGQVLIVLGLLNHFIGYLDLSLENFQSALEIFFENSGVNSEYTGSVTSNIAVVFFQIGDYSQSVEF